MEQMIANGIQLIKTNASYVFDSNTVFYRNEIPFVNQANEYDITECHYAQPIDFTDISVLQFLSVEAAVSCDVLDYLGNVLTTIAAVNVGTYDTQNVFNLEIDWSTIVGNLEYCYLQINDGVEYFKSEPLRMINLKQRIKLRYRMLRNHKSIGYFFNPDNEGYLFLHTFYIEAAVTEFKREIVKSVFEDSNQTLLNLFGTFRHSFLVKTFQIAYYMHEKVATLSLCDEIYLSEIRGGNEYEGRIFLSKDETPEEELIQTTNLYVSSTRYVVEDAFRLVGAAQETEIVVPPNLGIIPIHHTEKTGRKSTFQTPYLLLAGKTLYTPQGNPNEYLFKIGGVTDNFRNGHDVAWDIITSNTFAEFALLEVPVDSHVLVRYTGALTQTDIVSTLYSSISDVPVNPSTRTINPNPKTAAGDLMIYPKLVTGFDSVGFSSGAANLFSQQRTFAELANSSDLTDYNPGIVNLPITHEDGIGHLFLERTNTTPLVVNITTNQADTTREIIAYATPLNNEFYPTTADGTNPPAIRLDNINDIAEVIDVDVRSSMAFNLMPVGYEYSCFCTFTARSGFTAIHDMDLGGAKYNGMNLFSNKWYYDLQNVTGSHPAVTGGLIIDNATYTLCYNFTKLSNTGTYPNIFRIEVWVNGRLTNTNIFSNSSYSGTPPWQNSNLRLFCGGPSYGLRSQKAGRAIGFMQRHATEEEIRKYALGDEGILSTGCEYAWIFDTLNITPLDPNWRVVPNVGLLANANNGCLIKDSDPASVLGTLFT